MRGQFAVEPARLTPVELGSQQRMQVERGSLREAGEPGEMRRQPVLHRCSERRVGQVGEFGIDMGTHQRGTGLELPCHVGPG